MPRKMGLLDVSAADDGLLSGRAGYGANRDGVHRGVSDGGRIFVHRIVLFGADEESGHQLYPVRGGLCNFCICRQSDNTGLFGADGVTGDGQCGGKSQSPITF